MKKTITWIVVLGIVAAIGYKMFRSRAKQEEETGPRYTQAVVEVRDIMTAVESTGQVEPRNRLDVTPPIAGRLEELLIDEGNEVDKGQIIGWISSTERATLLDAALATSKEELAYWQELYKPTPLISPLKGTIIARNFEPGQSISSGEAVVVIADDLIVVANLDETDIGQIKVGQKVRVRLEAYPDQAFVCAVEKIAYDAITISNVTMYEVDVRPIDIPDFARSGMTCEVEFIVEEKTGTLAVSTAAIQQIPNGPPGAAMVMVGPVDAPQSRMVRTGITDGSYTEILEGLSEGEEVLVPGIAMSMNDEMGSNPFFPSPPKRNKSGVAK
ncbi:MAG: HlyD family efflux transporter periplasmic adaptor subunit [Pontiellaceae bacterium]|nr:HlyD family efflux transporter periplasmic adaptor subunit [Pontiellaceae bacterium]